MNRKHRAGRGHELGDSQVVNCGSDDSQIAMQRSRKRPVGSPAAKNQKHSKQEPLLGG